MDDKGPPSTQPISPPGHGGGRGRHYISTNHLVFSLTSCPGMRHRNPFRQKVRSDNPSEHRGCRCGALRMGPLISTRFHQAQLHALSSPNPNGFLLQALKCGTDYLETGQGKCISHHFLPILDDSPQTEPRRPAVPSIRNRASGPPTLDGEAFLPQRHQAPCNPALSACKTFPPDSC